MFRAPFATHRSLAAAALAAVAALVLSPALRGAEPEGSRDIPLSDLVPETTLFYATVPDLSSLDKPFQETGLAEIGRDPETKAFLEPILKMAEGPLGGLDEKLKEFLGTDHEGLLKLLKGQVSFALIDVPLPPEGGGRPDSMMPDLVFAVGVRESAGDAAKLLDRIFKAISGSDDEKDYTLKIGGTKAWQAAVGEPDSIQAAILGGTVIVATKASRLEEIVKRGGAAIGKPLSAGKGFKEAWEKTGTANKAFFAFVGIRRIADLAMKQVEDEKAGKLVTALGLRDLEDASLGITLEEKGVKEFAYLRTAKGAKGIPAWIASLAAVKESKLLDWVPADAVTFSRSNLALGPIFEEALEIAKIADEEGMIKAGLENIEKDLGHSISKDILPSLGPDVVSWSVMPERGLFPDGYTAIAVKDAKVWGDARAKALEALKGEESVFDYKGGKIHTAVFSLADLMGDGMDGFRDRDPWDRMDFEDYAEQFMRGMFLSVQLTWIDQEGAVVICNSPMAAKRLLQRGKPEKKIGDNPEYQRLIKLVGGEGSGAVEFYDFGPTLAGIYNSAAPFLVALNPGLKKAGLPIDLSRLPLGEELAEKVGKGILVVRSTPEGIQIEGYSRVGTLSPLLGGGAVVAGVAAAVAVPSLLRSQVNSNEASAIASLRTLVTSEEQYKTTDGAGKYTSLMALNLAQPPFIDSVLASGMKSGYSFTLGTESGTNYTMLATPLVVGKTGNRYFFADSSGVIRFNVGGPATSASPPIE